MVDGGRHGARCQLTHPDVDIRGAAPVDHVCVNFGTSAATLAGSFDKRPGERSPEFKPTMIELIAQVIVLLWHSAQEVDHEEH